MATKKKDSTSLARQVSSVPDVIRYAPIVAPAMAMAPMVDIAKLIGPTGEGWTEAPSSIYPMVDFDGPPPMYVEGYFKKARIMTLGDRTQYIYELADTKTGELFGVWGSTVIDDRMARLNPDADSLLLFVYVGDGTPKPGQNAARIFRIFARKPAQQASVTS